MKTVKSVKNKSLNIQDMNLKRFNAFQNTIFKSKYNPNEMSAQSQIFYRNANSIMVAAVLVIVTILYWLLTDIFNGGKMKLTEGPTLSVLIMQIIFSVYIFLVYRYATHKNERLLQYSLLAYYISLIIFMTALIVTKNVQMLEEGTTYTLAGIPLSSCYMFIFVLIPLPSKRDSFILGFFMICMTIAPALLPGHELYEIAPLCILVLCVMCGYWYIRNVNITLAESIQQLSILSYTDPLTKAFNRRALDTYWEYIQNNKELSSVGVLIFDIDYFKTYNDRYTHSMGDNVLASVCHSAVSVLNDNTEFLFRYGGEEFVIFLLNPTPESIVECGQRVRNAIYDADLARNDDSPYDRITVTIGCSHEIIGETGDTDFIVNADKQLYIGKNNNKNCIVFMNNIYR